MLNQVHNTKKMIELVKERPAIYDFRVHDFRNRAKVEKLWLEVANEMGTTTTDCKRKWVSLRNGLYTEIRKKEESSRGKKRKKWHLADNLEFLRIFLVKKQKSLKNVNIDQTIDCTMKENTNYFDHTTQDVNNYQTEEDIENTFSDENSFQWNHSNMTSDFKQNRELTSPAQTTPQSLHEEKHNFVISTVESSPSQSTSHYMKQHTQTDGQPEISSPALPPLIPFSNSTTCTNIYEEKYKILDEQNMTFFRSIIPDILQLSERKQRLYKQNVIKKLNELLDEQGA